MCSQSAAQTRQKSCMAPAIIQDDQDELSNPVQPHDSFYIQLKKKLNIFMVVFFGTLRPSMTQILFLCFLCNGRGSDAEKTHLGLEAVHVKSTADLKFLYFFSKILYEQVIPNRSHDKHHVSRVIISPCFPKL